MIGRENVLLQDLLKDARNFLRSRLERVRTVGDLIDDAKVVPSETAAFGLICDLVQRGVLLREHTVRQAFTLLVLRGPSLLSEQPA